MKRAPPSGPVSASMRPPCAWAMAWLTASPSPVPEDFVVKKGSKRRGRSSGFTPGPESDTATLAPPPARGSMRTSTRPPAPAASAAFFTRLKSTCRTRCGWAQAGASPSTRTSTPPSRRLLEPGDDFVADLAQGHGSTATRPGRERSKSPSTICWQRTASSSTTLRSSASEPSALRWSRRT